MHVIADVCVIPIGEGTSVSDEVALCLQVFREVGLTTRLHGYGTNLEGEWDAVMNAIKTCHERLHDRGVARISTSIKVGTRTDKPQTLADKIAAAESKLPGA